MAALRRLQFSALQEILRTRPPYPSSQQKLRRPLSILQHEFPSRTIRTRQLHTSCGKQPLRHPRVVRGHFWTGRSFASSAPATEQNLSLSQRLKKLSREYGWTALGVYLGLSALDFPFCFLAVRWLGTDRIGHWEHVVVSKVKELVSFPFGGQTQKHEIDPSPAEATDQTGTNPTSTARTLHATGRLLEEKATTVTTEGPYAVTDHGYKEAEAANDGANASLWTQLALAYAIHKSFIFIRVPLTAAILPKVVKTLRSWGYDIGKRSSKVATSGTVGVNTKGAGVKSD